MELRDALTQIAEIRQQMARGQVFRGYRAATTAFSGLVAIVTAILQRAELPALRGPAAAGQAAGAGEFVLLWTVAAGICLLAVGIEMAVRTGRSSQVQRQLTLLAAEQFVPSVVAGGLLTWAFLNYMPAFLWMLPGLWMILFSLGIFASARLLPRMVFGVAGFYLLGGIAVLLLTSGNSVAGESLRFSPWLMGGVFGIGQMMTAGILYYTLERSHGG